MTTLGFIGAGNIGGTVARLAAAAGYEVLLSNSRGPETLVNLAGELGPKAAAVTGEEAASRADLLLISVPLRAYPTLPAAALRGKVIVDTGNYYPARDGQIPDLDAGSITSGEYLQRFLAGARVVKAFNNIYVKHLASLARAAGSVDRTALPIAGDDPDTKATVAAFLDSIGYDAVDVGDLAASRAFGPGTPAYGVVYAGGRSDFAASPGVPAGADVLKRALAGG